MEWKSTADAAAEIRKAYKALGWTSRMISVRSSNFAGGSSIDVVINDESVDPVKAKELAETEERIHRCEITHEILAGCNRYVHVRYSDDCQKAMASKYVAPLAEALARVRSMPQSSLASICEGAMVGMRDEHTATIWIGDSFGFQFYPPQIEEAAAELAIKLRKSVRS